MKTCKDCELPLPLDRFGKDASKPSGLNNYCKACVSIRNANFNKRNPDYRHEYYLSNKMAIQERIETWQAAHKTHMQAYREKYYTENRDLINQRRRDRREAKTVSNNC